MRTNLTKQQNHFQISLTHLTGKDEHRQTAVDTEKIANAVRCDDSGKGKAMTVVAGSTAFWMRDAQRFQR